MDYLVVKFVPKKMVNFVMIQFLTILNIKQKKLANPLT